MAVADRCQLWLENHGKPVCVCIIEYLTQLCGKHHVQNSACLMNLGMDVRMKNCFTK